MAHPPRKKTESLLEKIQTVFAPDGYSDRLTLPPGLGGPSQIVVTIGKTVYLDGCKGLLDYEDDHVTLSLSDGVVTVYGQNLKMKTFSQNHLAIVGVVTGVMEGTYREELAIADR